MQQAPSRRGKCPWAKWPFSDALAVGVVGIAQSALWEGKRKEDPWGGFSGGGCVDVASDAFSTCSSSGLEMDQ